MVGNGSGISRRALLWAGAAASAWPLLTPAAAASAGTLAEDFATMRAQWRSLHVADGYDPADPALAAVLSAISDAAQGSWSTMNKSAGRGYLWEDAQLDLHVSFAISRSFWRLYTMALGWATPGSRLAGNAELLADTIAGLDWMVEHYYREDGKIIGNWYEWQISGPMPFNDAVVLLYDELTAEQIAAYARSVANFTPNPTGSAANLALTATVVVGRGTLTGDENVVSTGVSGLAPVMQYVTERDGFYRDGSFVQHDYYPYIGAYGASILEALVPIFTMVTGTRWQVSAPIVYDWLENAFDPVIWNGALMDMVSGRTIARWDQHEHYHGHYVLGAALGLLAGAPPERLGKVRSMLKEWLTGDTYDDPTPSSNLPLLLKATELREDASVERRGALLLSKVYHHQDRIVHRRESWALGISMRSSRIANFESINGENLRGWTTADGACYLYTAESGQFMEDYWATVDHARIPGTTVDVRQRQSSEGWHTRSPEAWAGGASLGNRYTAGGMRFAAQGSSLTCRKSWLCFDDEVVALGAAIAAHDGRPVETVVENRRLGRTGNERVTVNGSSRVPELGTETEVSKSRWMHLAGTGGYVFPTSVTLQLRREERTGRWSDVTDHSNWAKPDPITQNYLTAWIDHGVDPGGETYAYVLLPGASAAQTARYSAQPKVSVVANTETVQAVRHLGSGVLAANFWQPGKASDLQTTGPCSVVIRKHGKNLALSVADPTHQGSPFTLTLDVGAKRVISAGEGIQVVDLHPLTIHVDMTGAAGASRTVEVSL